MDFSRCKVYKRQRKGIKLLSEMSIVNYLIGRGWKLHLIQNVETGELAGATGFWGGLVGGSVTLSKNVYFFKALYEGKGI